MLYLSPSKLKLISVKLKHNSYLDLILQTAYSAKVMISGPNQFNKTVGQSTNIRCTLKFEEDEEFSEKPDLLWTDPKGNTGN